MRTQIIRKASLTGALAVAALVAWAQTGRADPAGFLETVKRHVTHILAKLGAANRTGAVARARQLNLIP